MSKIEQVIYTGKTHTTSGGRNGSARSSDGRLDIALSSPGTAGGGTNPERRSQSRPTSFLRRQEPKAPQISIAAHRTEGAMGSCLRRNDVGFVA
jgi:hypothetical protein